MSMLRRPDTVMVMGPPSGRFGRFSMRRMRAIVVQSDDGFRRGPAAGLRIAKGALCVIDRSVLMAIRGNHVMRDYLMNPMRWRADSRPSHGGGGIAQGLPQLRDMNCVAHVASAPFQAGPCAPTTGGP